ncbi:MAG: cytochrome c maturation protein CcmE [Alphaproteobacteria bacterium]
MKPKHQRFIFVVLAIATMTVAATLLLRSFGEHLIFFYTPAQLALKQKDHQFDSSRPMRLGGLVKSGSVISQKDGGIRFKVTDLEHEITVQYRGLLPTLFREGQGVVATGSLRNDGVFYAREILAKHDENYMPKEVADALKKSGQWKPE